MMSNDSSRYGPDWSKRSRRVRRSTFGICSLCWTRASKQTHHARYEDVLGPIRGREVPGWDIFPLCGSTREPGSCHTRVHTGGRWDRKTDRNTKATLWELRASYVALWAILRILPVMVLLGTIAYAKHSLVGRGLPGLPGLEAPMEGRRHG